VCINFFINKSGVKHDARCAEQQNSNIHVC